MSPFSARGDDEVAMSLHEAARNLNRHIFLRSKTRCGLFTLHGIILNDERFDVAQIGV